MFLYRLVRRRRQPLILVHAITFEHLFGFLSFLARFLALIYRLPDWILVDFHLDLDLEFGRSNMEFAISQPKVVRLPQNEKQTYRLNSRPQMWPMGLTLAMTLTFEFSRSNVILTIWWPRSGVRIYQTVSGVASAVGVPLTHLVISQKLHIIQVDFDSFLPNSMLTHLRPRQNSCHFPDDIFKWIFLNEKLWILIKMSLKFIPRDLVNNIPA